MPNNLLQYLPLQARRLWLLLTACLLVACAAPPPPQASFRSMDTDTTPLVFIANPDASPVERLEALSHFVNPPAAAFANLDGVLQKYAQGKPINESNGGLSLSTNTNPPPQIWAELLYAMAITGAPYACVQRGDQAYGAISLLAWEEFAAGQSTSFSGPNQCGNIAGPLAVDGNCDRCGCIPPMGGCPITGMINWSIQPTWDFSSPTPPPTATPTP